MRTRQEILNLDFLEARCQLLEIAAMLDRCDRAAGAENGNDTGDAAQEDRQIDFIYAALQLLADRGRRSNRSEQLLNMYSELA